MKISPIQLVIVAVSAITAAMIPSKSQVTSVSCLDGVEVDSSLNGQANGSTVTAQLGGDRSWTETGPFCVDDDFLSATSNDDTGTNTNEIWVDNCGAHHATAFGTTATDDE